MARIYATPADLPEAYRDDPNAETLIRRASSLVTNAIGNARFETDAWGMPTGDALQACHDAVVVQVSTWLSTGVNPVTGYAGKGKTVTAKGSNGSSVSFAVDGAAERYLNALAEGVSLTESASAILDAEGLLDVWLRGAGGPPGRLYAPRYQPITLPWVGWGALPILSGYVGVQRDEGVVRLQMRADRPGEGSASGAALLPEWAWPAGDITHVIEPGLTLYIRSTGNVDLIGPIAADYVEAIVLWEASRG